MFVAQTYGIELSFVKQIIVAATSQLNSIGAARIPIAWLVMISAVPTTISLPLKGIGLILAVDRIFDMFKTAVNVLSDSGDSILNAKSEGELLNYS